MIDKNFFRYATYDEYANDKASIPSRALVFVEDKRIIVTNGKEYGCIGTVSISDLDNWKPASQAEGRSGAYMLTSSYNATSGIMFCFLDSMMHGVHQVVLSNLVLNDGKVNDTHMDTGFTLLYRVYAYIQNGSTAPNNWTPWTQINLHDIPAALTAVTELLDNVTKTYDASTLSYDTASKTLEAFITDTSWDDADIIRARSTTTRTTATTINVYIQTLLIKAIVTRMATDGRLHHRLTVRLFPLSASDLAAGVYISAAGSVLSPSKSGDCYNATDSTNRLYYRIYHPATARTTARGMAFDVVIDILRRSTATTAYADVIIRII